MFFFPLSRLCCPLKFQTPHRPTSDRVSSCLETSPPSQLLPQDGSLSLTLLPLVLSVIFCPTSFRTELPAFLGAWGPLPVFRSCFVEVLQHFNDLLIYLCGESGLPSPIPPPCWDHPSTLFLTQDARMYKGTKTAASVNGAGKLDSYM